MCFCIKRPCQFSCAKCLSQAIDLRVSHLLHTHHRRILGFHHQEICTVPASDNYWTMVSGTHSIVGSWGSTTRISALYQPPITVPNEWRVRLHPGVLIRLHLWPSLQDPKGVKLILTCTTIWICHIINRWECEFCTERITTCFHIMLYDVSMCFCYFAWFSYGCLSFYRNVICICLTNIETWTWDGTINVQYSSE